MKGPESSPNKIRTEPKKRNSSQRPRLVDVAKAAGVATNTASMILNQRSNCWASEETKKNVKEAADRLGYRPSRIALAVQRGRYNTIGLMITDLNNPFFSHFASQLELAAEKKGFDLIIEHSRFDLDRENRCLNNLLDRQVDGIIAHLVDPHAQRGILEEKIKYGVPILVLGPQTNSPLPVDSIATDFADGLTQALLHLKELGHSRIGFIRTLAKNQLDFRQDGFFTVATRLGFAPKDLSFEASVQSLSGAKDAFNRLIKDPQHKPTAVIGLNDLCAIASLRGAWEAGLRVPQDISVIGFDNILLSDYTCPSLTTIAQPISQICLEAMEILLDRILGKNKGAPAPKTLSSKLIIRESTGHAPLS
jgi:LacI family transcriptional regulator